jgi:hypothetical protein
MEAKKVNLTVIFLKEVPLEIEYKEGMTEDDLRNLCIEKAKGKINFEEFQVSITVSTTDYIKNKMRSFK